jgi:hypothetical protein
MKVLYIATAIVVAVATNVHVAAEQSGSTAAPAAKARPAGHKVMKVLHGTVEKVDVGAKTIAIRTADGARTVVGYTDTTVVHGMAAAGKAAGLAGKEGAHVVVHYTDEAVTTAAKAGAAGATDAGKDLRTAGEKTAHAVVFVGDATLHLSEGAVVSVDRAGRTVAIESAKGAREVFQIGEDCTISTARGVERFATASGHTFRKGAQVVLYYSEEGGRKVVHAVDEVGHEL